MVKEIMNNAFGIFSSYSLSLYFCMEIFMQELDQKFKKQKSSSKIESIQLNTKTIHFCSQINNIVN